MKPPTPKLGDLIFATGHSYPQGWARGQDPHTYSSPTPVIFVDEFSESGAFGRTFYKIITPTGLHDINAEFCWRSEDEVR